MKIRHLIWYWFFFVLAVGCGGGGSGGTGGQSGVNGNVKALPNTVSFAVNGSQVTLTGNVGQIGTGDVIVSGRDSGLLRKVTGVSPTGGGNTVLQTTSATLEDVFSNAQIAVVKTLGASDVQGGPIQNGTKLSHSGKVSGGIHIDVPEVVIASGAGIDVKLDGSADLSIDLDFQCHISDLHLDTFRAVLTSHGDAMLRVRGGFSGINVKHLIRHIDFNPIDLVVGDVLGVPVVIVLNPSLDLFVVVRGDMSADFTATATASATIQAGAEYSNGSWNTIHSFSKDFSLNIEHNFSLGSQVTFCPLRTEGTVKLYDIVGPTFGLEPDFVCTYQRRQNPDGINVDVSGDFIADESVHAEALGHTFLDHEFPDLLNEQFDVYHHFFQDADTRQEVMVDNSNEVGDINTVGFYKWGTLSYWHLVNGYGINGSMMYTWNNHMPDHPLDNVGQWRPNLTGAGNYEVFAYIPANYATTTDANYEIWINGNYSTTVHVNQLAISNAWTSLGTYSFPAGGASMVRILDVTGDPWDTKMVGVDAVKFVPR